MKKTIIALAALVTASAQAGYANDADSSWSLSELASTNGIMIENVNNPKIKGIPNSGVSGLGKTVYTNITGLCIEGGNVQTKNEVELCVKSEWVRKDPKHPSRTQRFSYRHKDTRKVCVATDSAILSAPIEYTKQFCAKYTDKESRAWKQAHPFRSQRENFRTDYPNCSVFKTVGMTKKTSWSFNIVKKVSKHSPNYSSYFKGELLFKKNFSLPTCN